MKTFVFFGATGNLFTDKIFPALCSLTRDKRLTDFSVTAVGRRYNDKESYKKHLFHTIQNKDVKAAEELLQRTRYLRSDALKEEDYHNFPERAGLTSSDEVLFYLAVAPSLYQPILELLSTFVVPHISKLRRKIILEKPFGADAASFQELDKAVKRCFSEEDTFFVDHYLGKNTVQNLIVLKAENTFLERILHRDFVSEVRISVCESSGVGKRGKFYEETGAIRDILQNHLLQLLTLMTADSPPLCEPDRKECDAFLFSLSERKREILEHLIPPDTEKIHIGQYEGYRKEVDNPSSIVETLVSLPLYIDTSRWRGVPFRLLTGKKMISRKASIEVVFRSNNDPPNLLQVEIQPEERMDMLIHVKKPGLGLFSFPVRLNFSYSGSFDGATSEAYESILFDCFTGDRTLFPDSSFIQACWRVTDTIRKLLAERNAQPAMYSPETLDTGDFWPSIARFE